MALGLGVNLIVMLRSSAKTQGAVETGVANLSEKLDQHAADNRREFDAMGERIANQEKVNNEQWGVIREHEGTLGILQGRANGKAVAR